MSSNEKSITSALALIYCFLSSRFRNHTSPMLLLADLEETLYTAMIMIMKEYICFFIMLFVTLQASTDQCWCYLMFMFPPKQRSGVVTTIRILQTRNEMWLSECKEEESCRRASRLDWRRMQQQISTYLHLQIITRKIQELDVIRPSPDFFGI